MKLEQEDGLGQRGCRDLPRVCSIEGLRPPEIVGQVENPVLEAIRRLWWRAFDRVCYSVTLVRMSFHDQISGPEPPILADLQPEADHEWLVRAFPVVGETIEP